VSAPASPHGVPTSVVKLAWPVMVSNLLQTLTVTVDVIMVGSLAGVAASAVAAVVGLVVGRLLLRSTRAEKQTAATASEAEAQTDR